VSFLAALGLALAEIGCLLGAAILARILLAHQLPSGEVPVPLRHKVAMIDRFRFPLWLASAALCVGGLGLYVLR